MSKTCALLLWITWLIPTTVSAQAPQNFPAGKTDRADLPTPRTIDYDFQGVEIGDVEAWLNWFGIKSPVSVSGQVSGWLWAQRSTQGWFSFRDYRIEGELNSPSLTLDRWQVGQAALRFGYVGGVWYAGRLSGQVTPPGSERIAGAVTSYAKLTTSAPAKLELAGTIDRIDVATLLSSFEVPLEIDNKQGTLTFDATTPLASVNDIAAWNGTAKMQLQAVTLPQLNSPVQVDASVALDSGQWTILSSHVTLPQDRLQISGSGNLAGVQPYQLKLSGSNLSLERILSEFKIKALPFEVRGQVDVDADVRGVLAQETEIASATLRSHLLEVDDMRVTDIMLSSRLIEDRKVAIELEHATVAGGMLTAQASWKLEQLLSGRLPAEVKLSARNIQLDQLTSMHSVMPLETLASGAVDADVTLIASENNQQQLDWNGRLESRVRNAAIWGTQLGDFKISLNKASGESTAEAEVEIIRDSGSLQTQLALELTTDETFSIAHTQLAEYSATGSIANYHTLVSWPQLADAVPLTLSGDFSVSGAPQQWLKRGDASISEARGRILDNELRLQSLMVEFNSDEIRLRRFTLSDTHGRISGAAIVQRQPRGTHLLRLRSTGVEISPYWNELTPTVWHGLGGQVDLQIELNADAAEREWFADWTGSLSGNVSKVQFRGNDLGQVAVRGSLSEDANELAIRGELLGSQVTVNAQSETSILREFLPADSNAISQAPSFSVDVEGLQLQRLTSLILGSRKSHLIEGTASMSAKGKVQGQQLDMTGELRVPEFYHDHQPICRNVVVVFGVSDNQLKVKQASGTISGGRIELSGDYGLAQDGGGQPNGAFLFSIQGSEAHALVDLLYPSMSDEFAGKFSYRGRGRIGRSIHIDGPATVRDALAFGVPLQELRGTLSIDLGSGGGLQELVSNNLTGSVLGGQFTGQARLRGGASYELAANGQVDRGKMEQLSRALGFENIVGRGVFDGAFSLASRQAFDLNALRGRVQLDFQDGDAQTVPILSDLNRLVPLMQLASTDITGGTMHALIGQGELRIQDLLLDSEAFWIAASGDAGLASGRLDLEGVLQTGGGIEAQVSQSATKKLAAVIVPQVLFITEIDNLMRNRTLYFRVGGTTSQPVLQPKIAPTVARALLQRVRRELLAAPTTAANGSKGK